MTSQIFNVLFLCTGNSARSVLAECLLNHYGAGKFKAFSAGSQPAGKVNPFAVEVLQKAGVATEGLRSKSWDEFAGADAPKMDLIITVCDNAAGETCPYWPGHPATAHWGYPDPAAVEGSDEAKRAAFQHTLQAIAQRIKLFVALPQASFAADALQSEARRLAQG